MSLRNPCAELVDIIMGKSDLQSIFCLLVFCIVSLVLAYLTNPTENSFRTYLTEQSFRHHLSRLDDHLDSEQGIHHSMHSSRARNGPFHFANRASISLRTPKHVFHSFAIFTIAAMIPVQRSGSPSDASDGWSISDSWYIGAFGKWWRGGVWETWYQDVIARSKDEESWSSGILTMKNLDMLPDFHTGSYAPKTMPYHLLKQSPPRLRNRDHPVHKSPPPRSSSPPPLSKSASLPLHAKRVPTISNVERCDYLSPTAACLPLSSISPVIPTRSALFDQSPLIAEVLRQISASTASVQDLRAQYSEHQASAAQSRDMLNLELDSCRDRKRQDDASRSEMKTKTKTLDDQKRTAEGLKREAERKLKAAKTTRDSTLQRIESLDKEIDLRQEQTRNDRKFLAQKGSGAREVESKLTQALELKKAEIKHTEEALVGLNRRSRELEEKLALERERLEALKQRAELRMQEYPSTAYLAGSFPDAGDDTSYASEPTQAYISDSPSSPVHPDVHQFGMYTDDLPHVESPSQYDIKGYPGSELDSRRPQGYSNTGHSPSDRIEFSRSLQLDNDPGFNQAWNNSSLYSLSSTDSLPTPASIFSNFTDMQSESDLRPSQIYDNGYNFSPVDGTPASHYPWARQEVNLMDEMGYLRDEFHQVKAATTNGRLRKGLNPGAKEFSLPRKLSPPGILSLPSSNSSSTYDALNPNGLATGTSSINSKSNTSLLPSAGSTNRSLLRAFAPSRAEREALQRALGGGGSTNSSLERLPSLSEVEDSSSIPPSPSHVPLKLDLSQTTAKDHPGGKTFNLPSWLTVLPNIRKTRFKPWDDDEPVSATGG